MQRYFKENTVGRIIFISATILVGTLTVLVGLSGVVNKVATLREDLARLEEIYLSEQKEQLRADVTTLVERIDAQQDLLLRKLKQELATRVEESRVIAGNIYASIHDRVESDSILATIREAIRPIRFHDQHGYCFILNTRGDAILYPANPSIEGTNFFTNELGPGDKIVREMLDLTARQGHGYLRYDWYKPGDDSGTLHPKITYVSSSDVLGLVFGTGGYLDDLDELARNTVIDELKNSWRSSLMDYYFLYQLHELQGGPGFATMLININRPDLEGKRISDDEPDARGKAYRQEFMEGIRQHGEAHVVYWYQKPDGSGIGRKLSYFKLYPRWNWIVARGVYLDRLDAEIAQKQQEQRTRVRRELFQLGMIFLAGVGLSLMLAYWFSRQIQTIFDQYRATRRQHIDELQELNNMLQAQSRTDALTGIANRGHFNERLEQQLAQANRYGDTVCLLLFDIDHFKVINDSYGHLVGDQVLQELSRLTVENIRKIDLLARWGGEEFVILAPKISFDQAMQMAEKMRLLIMGHTFPEQLKVTCSFGVGQYFPGEMADDFMQRTDAALYQAKEQGRNQCCRAIIPLNPCI